MQNTALLLLLGGIVLLYCEFLWVGRIVFGFAGILLVFLGVKEFWNLPHASLGFWLLGVAAAAYLAEAFLQTFFLAGIAATVLLACGFWKLCPKPDAIAPVLVFPSCAVFGTITLLMLAASKRARRNKRSDV